MQRSGYYAWKATPKSLRAQADEALTTAIQQSFEDSEGLYPAELAQVCNLAALAPEDLEAVLAATPVNEVWGVGKKITEQLKQGGIHTALDLTRLGLRRVS